METLRLVSRRGCQKLSASLTAVKGTALKFSTDAVVPACRICASNAESVTEGGKPASQAVGLKFLRMENGAALFEAGAGEYAFVAK